MTQVEEQKNVKWILVISIIMLFAGIFYGQTLLVPYYSYIYPGAQQSIWDRIWYTLNRINVLLFIAAITTGTLFTAGFGNKDKTYRATIYLFVVSMVLLFVGFVRLLFV